MRTQIAASSPLLLSGCNLRDVSVLPRLLPNHTGTVWTRETKTSNLHNSKNQPITQVLSLPGRLWRDDKHSIWPCPLLYRQRFPPQVYTHSNTNTHPCTHTHTSPSFLNHPPPYTEESLIATLMFRFPRKREKLSCQEGVISYSYLIMFKRRVLFLLCSVLFLE